ncbi:l,D-transpeptidase YcbB [Flavobacterium subsaxonicum WB 4.1-42 = DSM 21790]|uniref:L,D-transpeptidase YcbB n=2 Tax=Flavobacterium TaxID=237 RepID=A0A0A2MQZ4_9FLAO|nr:l,D-transpeptidase YcbB [Flavobacterium subsaxonicum WB 4.1-42 = DSM 21790]
MYRAYFILIVLFCSPLVSAKHSMQIIQAGVEKVDSTKIIDFYYRHPDLKNYKTDLQLFYAKNNYQFIWYNSNGLTDFAGILYNELQQLPMEGIFTPPPYKNEFDAIFTADKRRADTDAELLITSLYLYYVKKVQIGLDPEKSALTGWHLPRQQLHYAAYLDTLIKNPEARSNDGRYLFSQYYYLKKALARYLDIQKRGGWQPITLPNGVQQLKPGDSCSTVLQVRKRLYTEGYLESDSGKTDFDAALLNSINKYKTLQNKAADSLITPAFIEELNITVEQRIQCIAVNMERCRWIAPAINNAKEFIAVNIPSFRLHYFREGKPFFISKVVVGKEATKTTVFSGAISYIVFNPYWNIPNSILNKEILPAVKKNGNYLAAHNMEWNGNKLRQRPGPDNPLGLVKFIFPNSNNIYLHDTPSKNLFIKEERAFSHGCIRVEKAREMALAIMEKEAGWTEEKTDKAMNAGKESVYYLKQKIPVYIGYFTAWADEQGSVVFYEDIYNRDAALANLLYN